MAASRRLDDTNGRPGAGASRHGAADQELLFHAQALAQLRSFGHPQLLACHQGATLRSREVRAKVLDAVLSRIDNSRRVSDTSRR